MNKKREKNVYRDQDGTIEGEEIRRQKDEEICFAGADFPSARRGFETFYFPPEEPDPENMGHLVAKDISPDWLLKYCQQEQITE